jgi:opine dehydrogenase
MQRRVTVLDTGGNGLPLAFHLAQSGSQVMLYEHPNEREHFGAVQGQGGIAAVAGWACDGPAPGDDLVGLARLAVTADMAEAVSFADLLLFAVPAHLQEPLFRLALPHFRNGQTVVLIPGSFGSFVLRRMLSQMDPETDLRIAEAVSCPYRYRVSGPGEILIQGAKGHLEVAALPAWQNPEIRDILGSVLPMEIRLADNVLEAALSDPAAIVRTTAAVLTHDSPPSSSESRTSNSHDALARVRRSMDGERRRIGRQWGLALRPHGDEIAREPLGSRDELHVREAVHEYCPCWLVPLQQLGELVDVEAPAIESILTLASIIGGAHFFRTGRTLERMGLDGMTSQEILAYTLDDQYAGSAMYPR